MQRKGRKALHVGHSCKVRLQVEVADPLKINLALNGAICDTRRRGMNELIHIHNQAPELRADSREVAKLFGVEHKSLRALIEAYEEEMVQLGRPV